MKTLARSILVISFLFSAATAFASAPKMMIQGKLMSIEKNIVTIKQNGKKPLRLPANALPDKEGLVAGKTTVTAFVTAGELLKLNPKLIKK